jgi:O-antigen/teichoic acid export membrane protein
MQKSSLKKNVFFSILRNVMNVIFPIITFPYASRILTPEGIGKVNFANSIVTYFYHIALLGITNYGIREGAKLRQDRRELSKFVKEIIIINIVTCFFSYLLFFITIFIIPKFYSYHSLLLLSCISIFFTVIGMDWFYNAIEDFQYIAVRSIVFQYLSLFFLFFFVKSKNDILWYIFFGIFGSLGSNVFNLIHIRKFIDLGISVKLELGKHIKPILVLFVFRFISDIQKLLGTTMLGFISNDDEVGYYAAALRIYRFVLTVLVAAITVLLPRLSSHVNKNEYMRFSNIINRSFLLILCISIPSSFGIYVLADPVVRIISGPEFINSAPSMRIMAPIFIFSSLAALIGTQAFISLNKEKLTIVSYGVGVFVFFILNLVLIPQFNSFGSAMATLISEFIVTLLLLFFARNIINWKMIIRNAIQFISVSIIMLIVLFYLSEYIPNIVIMLLISIPTGIIIYLGILLLIKNELVLSIFTDLLKPSKW